MKYIQYDANQDNINRMFEVQRQKLNHLKTLHTIYKKKQYPLRRQQQQLLKQRQLRIHNKYVDMERKQKQIRQQINYQNTILRNKLLNIYIPKNNIDLDNSRQSKTPNHTINQNKCNNTDKRISQRLNSSLQSQHDNSKLKYSNSHLPHYSPRKIQLQRQLNITNAKFFLKLSNIKSQVMPQLNLKQHNKASNYFKQMIMKKSPKKQLRFKKIISRNITQRTRLLQQPINTLIRQSSKNIHVVNPEEQFVFY